MDRDSSSDLLKQGCSRSVRLERGASGRPSSARIVKLFRSRRMALPAPLEALDHDRRRAAREFHLLQVLSERGLAVPRPLELARAPSGGWEVSMEYVPDAPSLMELFCGTQPWPREPARIARELGALLASLHAAGVRHADLHAGNVLIGAGPPVAIDFHKARLVTHPERGLARAATRNLTQLVAGSREFVSPLFRARFLAAWRRALPAELRAGLPEPPVLMRSVEAAGRLLRRATVLARRKRWTRAGTACRALSGGRGFVAIDSPEPLFEALAALADRGPGLRPQPLDPERQVLIVAGQPRAVRAGWYAAARLFEHRVPGGRPLAIALGARAWFAVELPATARPAGASDARGVALARLSAVLSDRGVRPSGGPTEHRFIDADGNALVAGTPDLVLDPAPLESPRG